MSGKNIIIAISLLSLGACASLNPPAPIDPTLPNDVIVPLPEPKPPVLNTPIDDDFDLPTQEDQDWANDAVSVGYPFKYKNTVKGHSMYVECNLEECLISVSGIFINEKKNVPIVVNEETKTGNINFELAGYKVSASIHYPTGKVNYKVD